MNHILFSKIRGIKGSSHKGMLMEIGSYFNGAGKITYGPEKRFEGSHEIIISIGLINYEFVIQDLEWNNKTLISYDRSIITGILFFWLGWTHGKTIKNRLNDWMGNTKFGQDFEIFSESEFSLYSKKIADNK